MEGKERRPAAKNHQSKNAPNAQAWILCFFLFMEGKERKAHQFQLEVQSQKAASTAV